MRCRINSVGLEIHFRRGQLGHGDLEDCDDPRIIDALAGLKVIQISANGWHSAVVTDQVHTERQLFNLQQ